MCHEGQLEVQQQNSNKRLYLIKVKRISQLTHVRDHRKMYVLLFDLNSCPLTPCYLQLKTRENPCTKAQLCMHKQEKSTEFSNAFSNFFKGKMFLKNIGYTIKQTIILHFKTYRPVQPHLMPQL